MNNSTDDLADLARAIDRAASEFAAQQAAAKRRIAELEARVEAIERWVAAAKQD